MVYPRRDPALWRKCGVAAYTPGPMKTLLALPLVTLVLVAGCASTKGPEDLAWDTPTIQTARLDYRICAVKAGSALLGSHQDPARDIARTAAGGCRAELVNLRDAIVRDNKGNPWAGYAADEHVKAFRDRMVDEVAALVMKERGRN